MNVNLNKIMNVDVYNDMGMNMDMNTDMDTDTDMDVSYVIVRLHVTSYVHNWASLNLNLTALNVNR
jgi:hypothetical protein